MNYNPSPLKPHLIFRIAVRHSLMWPWVFSWNWSPVDNRNWLRLKITKGIAHAIICRDRMQKADKRILHTGLLVDILLDDATGTLIKQAHKGDISLAKQIHTTFIEVSQKLLILFKHTSRYFFIPNSTSSPCFDHEFFQGERLSLHDLGRSPVNDDRFWEDHMPAGVWFRNDSAQEWAPFNPEIPTPRRCLAPWAQRANILTKEKWEKMQKAEDLGHYPREEIQRLSDLAKTAMLHGQRLALLEAVILLEVVLREFLRDSLLKRGLNGRELEDLLGSVTLSNLISAFVPLAIKLSPKHVKLLADLRAAAKLRNRIVHYNLPNERIDKNHVIKLIASMQKLLKLLFSRWPTLVSH